MELEDHKKQISSLYEQKGWNTDWRWLATGMQIETGELLQAILKNESQERIAEEAADVLHYFLELMNVKAAGQNLDVALQKKIDSNKTHLKKTTDEKGDVVFK